MDATGVDVARPNDETGGTLSGAGPRPGRRGNGLRQVEAENTKRAIVAAAAEVFAAKGYPTTTLKDVADIVGLTRPGLLHHFPSKETLFVAVLERERDLYLRRWEREAAGGAHGLELLRRMMDQEVTSATSGRLLHVMTGEAVAGNEHARDFVLGWAGVMHERVLELLRQAQSAGQLRGGIDLQNMARLLLAALTGLHTAWVLAPDADPRGPLGELIAALTTSTE